MKKQVLTKFLAVVFLLNTLAAFVWEKPCIHSNNIDTVNLLTYETVNETVSQTDIPCHQTSTNEQIENNSNHCNGVCLCLYFSAGSTLLANNTLHLSIPLRAEMPVFFTSQFISLYLYPPYRPPRLFS